MQHAQINNRRNRLIADMLRAFRALSGDHWARIDVRVWAEKFRRRAARLGISDYRTTMSKDIRTGAELISAERQRQVTIEGWTIQHDVDHHNDGDLSLAAIAYAWPQAGQSGLAPGWWPFETHYWKPKDRLRNLVRAGALIAAEIDRLQAARLRIREPERKKRKARR